MSKKTWYIIGAVVVVAVLIWGYKTKGWFGGTVVASTTSTTPSTTTTTTTPSNSTSRMF